MNWYVRGVLGRNNGIIGPFSKEDAEKFAEEIGGDAVTIDEYARRMIESSRNIIYRNQEGREERERKRRLQRTWFLSMRLRWK